jgi:PhzF family phenazine biosynthesis protein
MSVTVMQIDAFTDRPFAGNPAAVCLLDAELKDAQMQALAGEMNLPATAFVRPAGDSFALRWFVPAAELAFCGHGTLAAAHALWESGALAPALTARFHTRAGPLAATRRDGLIELDLPAEPAQPAEPPPALIQALGVTPRFVGRNRFDYLVEVDAEATVRGLTPDLTLLRTVDTRGVIVTARADMPGFDIVSRFFAPSVGIDEDSVTGSAHCCLGPFWAPRLGVDEVRAFQASQRGGELRVRPEGDRVVLGGRAITIRTGRVLAV